MSTSNRFTALTIAAILALTAVSCGNNEAEPAGTAAETTVETTTAVTTAETTVLTTAAPEPTEITTAETEPPYPEFDINSEECLMYRLLDMTYGEIVQEFGEDNMVSAGISDYGKYYDLYPYGNDESINVGYSLSSENFDGDSWGVSDKAIPDFVSIMYPSFNIYPGINGDMTASEVSDLVPNWDEVNLNRTNKINTILHVDSYTLNVAWELDDEFCGRIEADILGKSKDEVKVIKQKYADEFADNMRTSSSKIMSVNIKRNEKQ